MKSELKHVSREKPLQLFWTKRLSFLNPLNMDEEERTNERVSLPPKLSSVGPGITDHMLLVRISTHLHISEDSVMGQQTTMSWIDKNPAAYIIRTSPLHRKSRFLTRTSLARRRGRSSPWQ